MTNINYATTFCLVEALNDVAREAFALRHNAPYRLLSQQPTKRFKRTRDGTLPIHYGLNAIGNPILALTLKSAAISDPLRGLRFGSDDDTCDILLDKDNTRAVSALHFRLSFDWNHPDPSVLVLHNLSQNGTQMQSDFTENEAKILSSTTVQSQILDAHRPTVINAGRACLSFHLLLNRHGCEQTFAINWSRVIADAGATKSTITQATKSPIAHATKSTVTPALNDKSLNATPLAGCSFDVKYKPNRGRQIRRERYGTVFEACERSTGIIYAVKRFDAGSTNSVKEIDILRRLQHSHIVKYVAQEGSNVDPILIMEYDDGGNLEDLMANSVLPLDDCIAVWRQLLSALKYIHEQNVLHRDVKPSNILVASKPSGLSVKLCDFGLSTQERRARTVCGAQRYLAPEALVGKDRFDGKIDVWSAAVVILEALNGLPPQTESRDWTTEIISVNFSLLGIGFRSRILQRMLQLRPAERLSANDALRELMGFDRVDEQASCSSFDGAGRHEPGKKDSIKEFDLCGERYRQFTLNDHVVIMRLVDKKMDFTHLALGAGRSSGWIAAELAKIDPTAKEKWHIGTRSGSLINFDLAQQYIRKLGLQQDKQLEQFIAEAPRSSPLDHLRFAMTDDKMFYLFPYRGRNIAVCATGGSVNATHLNAALGAVKRHELKKLFRRLGISHWEHFRGSFNLQGTYVSCADALTICQNFRVQDTDLINVIRYFVDEDHTTPEVEDDGADEDSGNKSAVLSAHNTGHTSEVEDVTLEDSDMGSALLSALWAEDEGVVPGDARMIGHERRDPSEQHEHVWNGEGCSMFVDPALIERRSQTSLLSPWMTDLGPW